MNYKMKILRRTEELAAIVDAEEEAGVLLRCVGRAARHLGIDRAVCVQKMAALVSPSTIAGGDFTTEGTETQRGLTGPEQRSVFLSTQEKSLTGSNDEPMGSVG